MKSDNFIVIQGWMCNELELKQNDLLIYALIYGFSQDGETEYRGGRTYISETFNISLPTVDKCLKNLIEKELIEKIVIDKNGVTFNHYKANLKIFTGGKVSLPGVVKKLYGGGKETLHSNIVNNKNNSNILSKDNILYSEHSNVILNDKYSNTRDDCIEEQKNKLVDNPGKDCGATFVFGATKRSKPNLYQNCLSLIDAHLDTLSINNYSKNELRTALIEYLDLEMGDNSIRGANQWKGMLNNLTKEISKSVKGTTECDLVKTALMYGWKTFHAIDDKYSNKKGHNIDVSRDIEHHVVVDTDKDGLDHRKANKVF